MQQVANYLEMAEEKEVLILNNWHWQTNYE